MLPGADLRLRVEYLFPTEADSAIVAEVSGWRDGERQFAAAVHVERADRMHGARWTYLLREGKRLLLPSRSAIHYATFGAVADAARHEAFAYARTLAERVTAPT